MGEGVAPPDFLAVGHVIAPWGIRGEVKVQVLTDFPDRFAPGKLVYADARPLQIERCRPHKQHLLVKFAAVDSIADAEKLRGQDLTIPRSELRPLPRGEYYAFQVIGLKVITTGGDCLGQVTDVISTPANDVYIVEGARGETLIPAVDHVVKSIDLDRGEMVIEAIEGLLD